MKGKKKKKQLKKPADLAAVDAAKASLPDINAALALDAASFTKLTELLTEEANTTGLRALESAELSGAQAKALKRARYRLGQRGVTMMPPPKRAILDAATMLQSAASFTTLPVLMSAPLGDATRRFHYAASDGKTVRIAELYFAMPKGIMRAHQSAPLTPDKYRSWAQSMTQRPDKEGATFSEHIVAPATLQARKAWELSRWYGRGLLSPEADANRDQVKALMRRGSPPPHPIEDLALDGAQTVPIETMCSLRYPMRSFVDRGMMPSLRDQWRAFGGSEGIQSTGPSPMVRAVTDWIRQWGLEHVTEQLLDVGLFFGLVGDKDLAYTFRELGTIPDNTTREEAIIAFLTEWIGPHISHSQRLSL